MKNDKNQIVLQVKVLTNASSDVVTIVKEGKLEISVREKPKENAANRRVLQLIAQKFKVPIQAVCLISGHHRRNKKVSIMGHL